MAVSRAQTSRVFISTITGPNFHVKRKFQRNIPAISYRCWTRPANFSSPQTGTEMEILEMILVRKIFHSMSNDFLIFK